MGQRMMPLPEPAMNSFNARATLSIGERRLDIFRLDALDRAGFSTRRLPICVRVLLESLLRREDGSTITSDDIASLATRKPGDVAFFPARVLLQDFTGVPALVDLAAMRDALAERGGDPAAINPRIPVELVIDHSIQVDAYGTASAYEENVAHDYARNGERYAFLRWGREAFARFDVVPPAKGIVHQVNLERLARVVFEEDGVAFPDTVVGTDSHTPMVNGLGVLGWGVGGIEAEAAMLGQPIGMMAPPVIGLRFVGALSEGVTATDVVLTVTERLRARGVVGHFVEAHGPGVASLRVADRATISNMSPEFGATATLFPVDDATLSYLRFTGRSEEQLALVERYMKTQGLFFDAGAAPPEYDDVVEIDLSRVEPSVAGPRRPQERAALKDVPGVFARELPSLAQAGVTKRLAIAGEAADDVVLPAKAHGRGQASAPDGRRGQAPAPGERRGTAAGEIDHGAVVIAAITSCTNTSNPAVMIGAGLVAKNAVARGLAVKPWVKTSLAPGSPVVMRYLEEAGLRAPLEQLGFALVGYGCTTCIGNSGPLPEDVSREIARRGLVVCAVLSGNRNFEARIHAEVRANWLMSPMLVVVYAIAGRVGLDLTQEPLGVDASGAPVFLRDVWPSNTEIEEAIRASSRADMFRDVYATLGDGGARWDQLPTPTGDRYAWDARSTYVKLPPYVADAAPYARIEGARALLLLGDGVTTDHISPAGSIKAESPAGRWLMEHGVEARDFNSYGSRRGNHEVMMRGTFANPRIRNRLAPGTEGGVTTHLPSGDVLTVFDAATRYRDEGVPLCVIAGKEYGSGSSRDWAAKGPKLLGVRFVLAESYERIHRSNLVGMGIVPLQFEHGASAASLGLSGRERFDVDGLDGRRAHIVATRDDGSRIELDATVRIDTEQERLYMQHGGILPFVLHALMSGEGAHADGHAFARGDEHHDGAVEQSSIDSFPASDSPSY